MNPVLPLRIPILLVLGIIASLAIAAYAELGFQRLQVANQQMQVVLDLQTALLETQALVVDAETGGRGYLLTGKEEYLQPYNEAIPKIDGEFHRLRELLAVGGKAAQRDTVGRINGLVGKKLSEVEAAIALYRNGGAETAQALTNTGIGKRTMDEIRAQIASLTDASQTELSDDTKRWAADIAFARAGMRAVTVFAVALLLLVWLLMRRDVQQREKRRLAALEDNKRLETIVEDRTAELTELFNHLQVVREDEKSKLARDLHDELGGILVSVKMDVAWAQKRLKKVDPEAAAKLERAQQALYDGVQIKRRIIEDLRPTLLDNLGLSSALDWQTRQVCDRAGIKCTISTPVEEIPLDPASAIVVYRILQESLTNVVKYARAKNVFVTLRIEGDRVTLSIEDDGIGIAEEAQHRRLSHGIIGMRQRVKALGGQFSIGPRADGGTVVAISVPLVPESAEKVDSGASVPAPVPPPAAAATG